MGSKDYPRLWCNILQVEVWSREVDSEREWKAEVFRSERNQIQTQNWGICLYPGLDSKSAILVK